jgi:hypothetical protein
MIGRIYQLRIIGRAGVLGVDDYEDFLIFEESTLVQHEQQKIKEAAAPIRRNTKKRKSSVVVFKSALEGFLLQQQKAEKAQEKKMRKKWHRSLYSRLRSAPISPLKPLNEGDSMTSSNSSMTSSVLSFRLPSFSLATKTVVDNFQLNTRKYFYKLKRGKQTSVKIVKVEAKEKHIKFSEDLSEIFFLNSPFLFFKAVEIAILMNSLYLSIWFCNYMTCTSLRFEKSIIMIIPIIICFLVIGEIVKAASLIKCTATLNLDVVGTIIEDLEAKQQLKNDIQEMLKNLAKSENECREAVDQLFTELAFDGRNDEIDKDGFRQILGSLKIFFRFGNCSVTLH